MEYKINVALISEIEIQNTPLDLYLSNSIYSKSARPQVLEWVFWSIYLYFYIKLDQTSQPNSFFIFIINKLQILTIIK